MLISVIIPVVQREMFFELMQSINRNTLRPNQIITVDNSQHGVAVPPIIGCKMDTIRNTPILDEEGNFHPGNGTNEAWKQGIATLIPESELVVFLNDDVYLNRLFFEKTYQAMAAYPKCGYLIPSPCADIAIVKGYQTRNEPNKIKKTKERHGWAFTLRRSFLDKCPPIPDGMTIWYGDNWFGDLCHHMGYQRLARWDNPVYHYDGTTSKQELQKYSQPVYSRKRRDEHDVFLRAMRALRKEREQATMEKELAELEQKRKKSKEVENTK